MIYLLFFKAVAQAQRHGGAVETTQKCKFMPPGSLHGCNGNENKENISLLSCFVNEFSILYTSGVYRRKEEWKRMCNNFVLLLDGAGANKQHSSSRDTAKLDRETEELHRK